MRTSPNPLQAPFDVMYAEIKAGMVAAKTYADSTYKAHQKAENEWLVTIGPLKLNETMDLYEGHMTAEVDCFVYTAGSQVESNLSICEKLARFCLSQFLRSISILIN